MPRPSSSSAMQATIAQAIQQATVMHRGGWLDQAERIYGEILKVAPGHFDALHLLGVLYQQYGRSADALRLIDRALAIDPKSASAHSNRGAVLNALGRPGDALAALDRALALSPDYVDARSNRGVALRALGRLDEAYRELDRTLALAPDHVDALANRAGALIALERFDEAARDVDRALALAPGHAVALSNRGDLFRGRARYVEALDAYAAALRANAKLAPAIVGRVQALIELGRFDEALRTADEGLVTLPNEAMLLCARGDVLEQLGRFGEAIAGYEAAIAANPDDIAARNNIARALTKLDRPLDALAHLEHALALAPDLPDLKFNAALCHLYAGNYAQGWRQYEARWGKKDLKVTRREFPQPLWLGDGDIAGKTILLHAEQGFGDTLHFVRYANVVAQRGAKVILDVQAPLRRLAASSFPDLRLVSPGEPPPPFDLHAPLLSLPHACGTTLDNIPWAGPYLEPAVELIAAWARELPSPKKPRVGIVWAGKATQSHDRFRSLALSSLHAILSLPQIAFVCLQHEMNDNDAEVLARHSSVTRLARGFADFADTAAVIAQLDCVVAVDTAVAHLAAAMGKPVLLMLPFGGDWHWVVRGRSDSPWYPTVQLYRQHTPGDWSAALEAVRQELIRRGP